MPQQPTEKDRGENAVSSEGKGGIRERGSMFRVFSEEGSMYSQASVSSIRGSGAASTACVIRIPLKRWTWEAQDWTRATPLVWFIRTSSSFYSFSVVQWNGHSPELRLSGCMVSPLLCKDVGV